MYGILRIRWNDDQQRMRVLLVDDDREVADYVRRELEEESFDVVVAHDGALGCVWLRLPRSTSLF